MKSTRPPLLGPLLPWTKHGIALTHSAGLYNSYGALIFFFPKRVTGTVTEINAHDSSRRADMRVSTTLPSKLSREPWLTVDPTGKLTAVSALPCGTEARVSLSGPMFGPNGSTLLLNDQAVVVAISSAPAGKVAVEVDEDTVSAIEASLDEMETGRGSGKDETSAEGRERHLTAVLHHRRPRI